ncbi:MAG: hypothetical protein QOH25_584 [Acidobacteriota bacterium]|jgi:uncharacterized membrane protein (DUF485 family)|nr:hypothetical protein [Acidobacteriota bacterium]
MSLDNDQSNEAPDDLTPVTGAATDVSPLGREGAKPSHELTADEDTDVVNWNRIAASDEFKGLIKAKLKFIVPATVFFVVYYFALPVLVGYAPDLMKRRVFGVVNVAYLFALSQFFMAWIIALLYVRAAARHDRIARSIADRHERRAEGGR